MGLDMWLYRRKHDNEENDVEIGYWRKFNELYGFIENLKDCYDTNCQEIELDLEDLEEIRKVFVVTKQMLTSLDKNNLTEEVISEYFLPYRSGFFFGGPVQPEEIDNRINDTLNILDKAIKLAKQGEVIYFYAWY